MHLKNRRLLSNRRAEFCQKSKSAKKAGIMGVFSFKDGMKMRRKVRFTDEDFYNCKES
jgi:hypothetical protein